MACRVSLRENRHEKIPSLVAHQQSNHLSFDADSGEQLPSDAVKIPIGDWCIAAQFRSERIPAKSPPNLAQRLRRLRRRRTIAFIAAPIGDLEAVQTGNGASERHIDNDRMLAAGSQMHPKRLLATLFRSYQLQLR